MNLEMLRSHRSTYDAVFRHPVARNLQWVDLRSMLGSLAEVAELRSGTLKFTRNGESLFLHPPRHKDFSDVQELMDVRHFLERCDTASPESVAAGVRLLAVIDHREARVYRAELHGSVPQRVVPYDPRGLGRHLHDVQVDGKGQRQPERKGFYESVAKALRGAGQILVFGSGTASSSAMDQLLAALKRDHADIASRVVGSLVVDARHLTEDQLLAKARDFYANRASERAVAAGTGKAWQTR